MRIDVASIRDIYVSKAELEGVRAELQTLKEDVAVIRSNYVTRADFLALKEEVAVIRSNYVTKADLIQAEVNMQKWVVKVGLATFAIFTSLQFAMFSYFIK